MGGAVSHNAMFFGSGSAGSIAGSVFGLEVVLADGRLLHTGVLRPDSVDALPHGPDLTHLFVGDCGAFGVKSRVALRLAPVAGAEAFLSMAFDDPLAMLDAQDRTGRPARSRRMLHLRPSGAPQHSRPADRFPGKARRRCRRSARNRRAGPRRPPAGRGPRLPGTGRLFAAPVRRRGRCAPRRRPRRGAAGRTGAARRQQSP